MKRKKKIYYEDFWTAEAQLCVRMSACVLCKRIYTDINNIFFIKNWLQSVSS